MVARWTRCYTGCWCVRAVGGHSETLYSWHSARIYLHLATVMYAAGASTTEIQALCRWQSEESVKIYAWMNRDEYARVRQPAGASHEGAGDVGQG